MLSALTAIISHKIKLICFYMVYIYSILINLLHYSIFVAWKKSQFINQFVDVSKEADDDGDVVRGGSRTPVTSKMDLFVTIVNGWKVI